MNAGQKTAIKRAMRMLFCTAVLLLAFGAMLTFTVPMRTLAWAESEDAPLADAAAEPAAAAAETEEPPAEAESPVAETEEPPAEGDSPAAEAEEPSADPAAAPAPVEDTSAAAENTAATQESMPAVASAAGEDNPAEPVPSIPEDQVEVEAYAIPAGSVYIHEISKEVKYSNSADNNGNAINEAFADALTYLCDLYRDEQSGAERTATIVVQDGLYLNGVSLNRESENNIITKLITDLLELKSNSLYSGDMTIRIVAHDAIVEDEQGKIVEINADSQGNVKLEGGINIDVDGINLLLAGLYLSTRDAVSVNNAGSVEYYGTAQDDTINLSVSNIKGSTGTDQYHIILDSGAGNDTVNVEVRRKPNVNATVNLNQNNMELLGQVPTLVNPDAGFDDVLPYINTLKESLVNGIRDELDELTSVGVNVKLGDGEDVGSIRLIDASDVIVSLLGNTDPDGNPLYTFGFAVDMGGANVVMDGGNGEDRLSVTGGRDFSFAQDFMKAAVDFVTGELSGKTLPTSGIVLSGGQGDDLITVDTTVPFAAWGSTDIEVTDQAG